MERVLRKIHVSDRLPEDIKEYLIETSEKKKYIIYKHNNFDWRDIEYWFEEVEVSELEDFKVAVGNLEMINEMDIYKANERYKKALETYIEETALDMHDTLSIVKGALKIAAGLEEV